MTVKERIVINEWTGTRRVVFVAIIACDKKDRRCSCSCCTVPHDPKREKRTLRDTRENNDDDDDDDRNMMPSCVALDLSKTNNKVNIKVCIYCTMQPKQRYLLASISTYKCRVLPWQQANAAAKRFFTKIDFSHLIFLFCLRNLQNVLPEFLPVVSRFKEVRLYVYVLERSPWQNSQGAGLSA
jgi:hypothetical protein